MCLGSARVFLNGTVLCMYTGLVVIAVCDLPPNMRLVILAVSSCGSINPEGHTFIDSSLAQRMDNSIPPALLHQASWATPRLGPMIRMALGFAVRRGLAAAVHRWWRHVPSLGLAPLLLRQRPRQLDDDRPLTLRPPEPLFLHAPRRAPQAIYFRDLLKGIYFRHPLALQAM